MRFMFSGMGARLAIGRKSAGMRKVSMDICMIYMMSGH